MKKWEHETLRNYSCKVWALVTVITINSKFLKNLQNIWENKVKFGPILYSVFRKDMFCHWLQSIYVKLYVILFVFTSKGTVHLSDIYFIHRLLDMYVFRVIFDSYIISSACARTRLENNDLHKGDLLDGWSISSRRYSNL